MPAILIRAARVLTPDEDLSPGAVLMEGGRITAVDHDLSPREGVELVDLPDATLVPGFIDLHVHGGGGYSLMAQDPEEIQSYARWVVSYGVTGVVPTICASNLEVGLTFVRTVASVTGPLERGATILGVNLEGPFVSMARRGALPERWITSPDAATLDALATAADGHLRIMTLAPDIPGAQPLIGKLTSHGVVASIGHTDADFETSLRAFAGGAAHVTHAFNAMRPFHHRDPGPIGAALQSKGVTVEIIADGTHLHPATVELLVRSFGADRIALVTDGVTPAGLPTGAFLIGNREAKLEGGRMVLPDGTIAGGAATMDQLVRNIVQWRIASLRGAVRMASTTPAGVIGLARRKGRITVDYDADLGALNGDLKVLRTWVGGSELYPPTSH